MNYLSAIMTNMTIDDFELNDGRSANAELISIKNQIMEMLRQMSTFRSKDGYPVLVDSEKLNEMYSIALEKNNYNLMLLFKITLQLYNIHEAISEVV